MLALVGLEGGKGAARLGVGRISGIDVGVLIQLSEPLRGFADHLAHVLRVGTEDDVLAVCRRHVPGKDRIHSLGLFKVFFAKFAKIAL